MIFHNFSVAFAVDCLRLFAATKTLQRVRVERGHTMIEEARGVGEGASGAAGDGGVRLAATFFRQTSAK